MNMVVFSLGLGIPCLTRSALILRLASANPLKTLICRHICGVTDHVSRPSLYCLSLLMCSFVHSFLYCQQMSKRIRCYIRLEAYYIRYDYRRLRYCIVKTEISSSLYIAVWS